MLQKNVKKWEVRRRLEFIESRLYWEGRLNRSDLVDFFGISILQASKDIAQYQELAPGNLSYDTKQKQYYPSSNFLPKIIQPDAAGYLGTLQALSFKHEQLSDLVWGTIPEFNVVPTPVRSVGVETLRTVLKAIREQAELRVYYQSMTRPEPLWRWIAPHALSFDGLRWHTRAYCHETQSFRDFLLSRILEVGESRASAVNAKEDHDWHSFEILTIAPNPKLSDSQKKVIEHDYGMVGGCLDLKVRAASVLYALKRLDLDQAAATRGPEEQQIVLCSRKVA